MLSRGHGTHAMAEQSVAARFRARAVNPLLRVLMRSPLHRMLSGSVLLIAYSGRRSGRRYTLPVMYASAGDDLVVVAGDRERKTWWRNFTSDPQPVSVTLHGRRSAYTARRLDSGTDDYNDAVEAYERRFPGLALDPAAPVIALGRSEPLSERP
jgi:deazaflavin-dependent oxidoreductase (nitroreductase family)